MIARARIAPLLASQGVVAAALAVSRMRPALTWRALDGDLLAGEISARLRPDNRWFVYFDTWRADAYPPLADAVARDLGRDLYVTLEDAEYDALDACAQAGFAVHRRESYYRIPADPAVTGLAGAVLPDGLDVLSAADADIARLRLLDDALRQDVPGCEGWQWDAEQFRAETFSPFFDPATYVVAVDRAGGQYTGLVRIWRNRAGPRLGLIATLAADSKNSTPRSRRSRFLKPQVGAGGLEPRLADYEKYGPVTTNASCRDNTDHRTYGTHRAGIILRAIPRRNPSGPRHPITVRKVAESACLRLGPPYLGPRAAPAATGRRAGAGDLHAATRIAHGRPMPESADVSERPSLPPTSPAAGRARRPSTAGPWSWRTSSTPSSERSGRPTRSSSAGRPPRDRPRPRW